MNQLCFNSVTFAIGFREPADHEPTDHAPADHEPADHAPTNHAPADHESTITKSENHS